MNETNETKIPYITVVSAPGIPISERKHLETHFREAFLDSDYVVVLNYECNVTRVWVPVGETVLVQAPGVPTSEVLKLNKQVTKALKAIKQIDRLVVTNHEVYVAVV